MPTRQLTDKMVAALKVSKRKTIADPKLSGHYLRVTPNGAKTFVAVARDPRGIQVWHKIGSADHYTIEQARDKARAAMKAIKEGVDRAGPQSFESVANEWFKRHVEAKALRSLTEVRRYLDKHIMPVWGGREFTTIKRGDVAKLLDRIEDEVGPVAADKVLAHVSKLCRWYQARHDDYVSPVVPGMRRSVPKERARDRILSDDEIRAMWKAEGAFGDFVKLCLLTAQRREKIATMRWADISDHGVWSVPSKQREKGVGGDLMLPAMALEIIRARPRFASNPYVFAGRGKSHFSGYSKAKAALGGDWRLHDLRRTARSLMSRSGIRPDIAERVLGHVIKGVEGTYDRHTYAEEKAHALKALAGLIENILAPQHSKVRSLRG
jgi:integrase